MQEKELSENVSENTQTTIPPASIQRGGTGLQLYTGQWTDTQALHLARRTLFGATVADVKFLTGMSMNQAVNYLLTIPNSQPASPLKSYTNSTTSGDQDAAISQGSTWVDINTTDGGVNAKRRQSLKNWWIGLMLNQERNILEKMVLFWHNHFATETNDIGKAIWCYQNNVTIRKNALGNFKYFKKECVG